MELEVGGVEEAGGMYMFAMLSCCLCSCMHVVCISSVFVGSAGMFAMVWGVVLVKGRSL